MKILFYDWALFMIGGGQKFNCKIIEHLSKKHKIDILTLFPFDKKKLEDYYSVDLSKVNHIINLYDSSKINPTLLKLFVSNKISEISKHYDVFFNADAQETIKPGAKNNIMYCHFFEPRWYRPAKGFLDFCKLCGIYFLKLLKGNYSKKYRIFCNSDYTKRWLKKLWHINAEIIYPPIDLPKTKKFKKENLIISTGRISPDKNYEFIINIFKQAYKDINLKDYRLLICGKIHNINYSNKLKRLIKDSPIQFLTNLSDNQLKEIYEKSKIFIQAKGFNINENKYPGLLEHFGMTTAEAMSYACIPIVLNKGGYGEIVDKNSGFLFESENEAIENLKLIIKNKKLMKKISLNAREKVEKFNLKRMQKQVDKIIQLV